MPRRTIHQLPVGPDVHVGPATPDNWRRSPLSRPLEPEVRVSVWPAIELLVPVPLDHHPLGRHRRRKSDRDGCEVMLTTGWPSEGRGAGVRGKVSDTTARTRRDEWVAAGVVEPIVNEARSGSDTIVGRDLSDTAVDGSRHTCPSGGEGTGKNPTDRSTLGREWPVLTDPAGIPIGGTVDGAHRSHSILLEATLDNAAGRGLSPMSRPSGSSATTTPRSHGRLAERGIDDAVIGGPARRDRTSRRRTSR
jgi:hypothetical protein